MRIELFTKHNWGKWEHVIFVGKFTANTPAYEILRRECSKTGYVQYKQVKVGHCVHDLAAVMTQWHHKLTNK